MKTFFKRIPFSRVNWVTSVFLMCTLSTTLTAVPWYIWQYGLDLFQISLFFALYAVTGLSITLGYHRLFSHLSFQAKWPVKLFVLIFGAASFENAALDWCSDHRRHHKHTDGALDPYDISMGFWFAHIGWLLFKLKPKPPMDNIIDLRKDPLVVWQHRWITPLSVVFGFGLPALIGGIFGGPHGALGGFLIGGVARIVAVQHSTFCINSLCHTIGNRPYSTACSARDSWIAALVTFGEGYHNYHHEFQHDYRNGVKFWQFDPTKWTIWTLSKLGLVKGLRRVAPPKILLAEVNEAQQRIDHELQEWERDCHNWSNQLSSDHASTINKYRHKLKDLSEQFRALVSELRLKVRDKTDVSPIAAKQYRHDIHQSAKILKLFAYESSSIKHSK